MSEEKSGEIVLVDVDRINVPRERVTAVWDAEVYEEFIKSVEQKGILEPLTLMKIDDELWLIDGLHRLQAAEELKMAKVPAVIIEGSLEELLIQNIIRNRQRGKSNPAQEAEVLSLLVEKRGFPLEMAAKQLGLSPGWAKQLLKIARLPDEVKDLIKHGKVPVTGAVFLADLPRPEDQVKVARDAELYGYNAYQIKKRVWEIINPDVPPEPGDTTFTPEGKPIKVPLTCHFCGAILDERDSYVWICRDCYELARDTIEYYRKTYVQPQPQEKPQNAPQ